MARVLVVDDEPDMRDIVSRALSHAGHDVDVAADGAAALGRLDKEGYDLLIKKIGMPINSGVALAKKDGKTYPANLNSCITMYGH